MIKKDISKIIEKDHVKFISVCFVDTLGQLRSKLVNKRKVIDALNKDGKGLTIDSISSNIDGIFERFEFNNYDYRNVEVLGFIENRVFSGQLKTNDLNLKLYFKGLVDFSKNENIIRCDLESITGKESTQFLEHRHDQSILTNLAVKHNCNAVCSKQSGIKLSSNHGKDLQKILCNFEKAKIIQL